ncbi:MAG: RNA methyltransferase [Flavobacteriaceae bacterium]
MISKSEIKLITSLQQKKYRNIHGLFIAEGKKIISDLVFSGVQLQSLFATEDVSEIAKNYQPISENELKKISVLKNANGVLAVFEIPNESALETKGLQVVLDRVRDPGNLGTVIRLCDWFGVSQIICSRDTVDCYNPKVVQATMGSIARVSVHYKDLKAYLRESKLPIYTAVMKGANVYSEVLPKNALLVMGNEAQGVSEEIMQLANHQITIPNFSKNRAAESLNVAMATGILLSEFRRTTET